MTNESKKTTEKREDILLRILTKFFRTDENDETVPTAAQLQRLDNYLEERGITPERFEEDCKKSEDLIAYLSSRIFL